MNFLFEIILECFGCTGEKNSLNLVTLQNSTTNNLDLNSKSFKRQIKQDSQPEKKEEKLYNKRFINSSL